MYMIAEVSQYVAVASFAEAWIEIHTVTYFFDEDLWSPPSRRRGLKYLKSGCINHCIQSPPSRRRGLKFKI